MTDFLHQIDNLFTEDECNKFISKFMDEYKNKKIDEIRDKDRIYDRYIFYDEELAIFLFEKIKMYIPKNLKKKYKIIKLNSCFRMSRYHKNMKFGIHKDGMNRDKDNNISYATLNIFMNKGFKGGNTIFYEDKYGKKINLNIKPDIGRGAFFYSQQYHCGEELYDLCKAKGKFLLRTDLMIGN